MSLLGTPTRQSASPSTSSPALTPQRARPQRTQSLGRPRQPSPDDSMRDAVFTVSPNRQYLGILVPTTPAMQEPASGVTIAVRVLSDGVTSPFTHITQPLTGVDADSKL